MAVPTLIVEAAFSAGASTSTWLHLDDTARGLLDTATLGGEDVWTDITDWVQNIHIQRGSRRISSPVVVYDAGTAVITLNNSDRRFDPSNLDGPYVAAGVTQVTPMRAVRVRATWSGTTYDLFRGFADDWLIDYEDPNYSWVTLPCTDGFKVLENRYRSASSPAGASEDSGARVNRILDSADWSDTDRVVSTGDTTLQATDLEGKVLTELRLVAETEIGELYIDGAGRVVFRNRLAVITESRSTTSQATFGSDGSEFTFKAVRVSYDDSSLANEAFITRSGGTEQVAQDTDSQALYLARTHRPTTDLLMETDAEALDYAAFIVHVAKDPELRFSEMVVIPHADETNLFPEVLGREIGDRITVIKRPPGGGDPIERDVFIRGVDHTIRNQLDWVTTWTLQSATKYSFLILDHATLGQLDNNALAY